MNTKKVFLPVLMFVALFSTASAERMQVDIMETTVVPKVILSEPVIACTMDAKICPDGSYVGRVAPKCEFALCPSESPSKKKILPKKSDPIILGNDKDEYGCIGSAGYIWSAEKTKCVRSWEEKNKNYLEQSNKISDNCKVWFDGCNNCSRDEKNMIICTMRFCEPTEITSLKCLEYFNDDHQNKILIEKIANAKTEEDRIIIFNEKKVEKIVNYKADNENNFIENKKEKFDGKNQEQNLSKTQKIISEKSGEIFTKFDIILAKIKDIILVLEPKITSLEKINLDVSLLRDNLLSISQKIEKIEEQKATTWILMQETIIIEDKAERRNNIEVVKISLRLLKNDVKIVSAEIRNLIKNLRNILDK